MITDYGLYSLDSLIMFVGLAHCFSTLALLQAFFICDDTKVSSGFLTDNTCSTEGIRYEVIFKQLHHKVSEYKIEDVAEQKFLEHFDFVSWVKSKVKQHSFKEVYLGRLK